MKHIEDYISPLSQEIEVELESALCATSPVGGTGSIEDFEYELYPEIN